ncbi:MAG: hypothetical protein ACXW31_12410 [Thermoanaerobaculia bacterium]
MYDYHNTEIRAERLAKGRDHCDSGGPIYELARLVSAKRIRDPERGDELTTNRERRLIYAVSTDLRVHVGFDGERGTAAAVKHETLFHNEPVEAAGEMQVAAGVVVAINDHSGSYGTVGLMEVDSRMPTAVLAAFLRAEVPMADAVLDSLTAQAGV